MSNDRARETRRQRVGGDEKSDTGSSRRPPRGEAERRAADSGAGPVPEKGLGLGREGHGGVLLPGGHREREEHEERAERRGRRERRGARGGGPYDDEGRPEEASDR